MRIVRPYPLRAHLQQDGLYSRVERDGVSFSSRLFALDSSSILLASSVSGGSPKRSRSPPTSGLRRPHFDSRYYRPPSRQLFLYRLLKEIVRVQQLVDVVAEGWIRRVRGSRSLKIAAQVPEALPGEAGRARGHLPGRPRVRRQSRIKRSSDASPQGFPLLLAGE